MLRLTTSGGLQAWEAPLPPQARGRRRRNEIIEAAIALIDEFGPSSEHVSVKAIAARAGTSAATIYHYFADIEALFAAVALRFMDGLVAAEAFEPADLERTDRLFARTVEAERAYVAKHPGLRELWFDRRASDGVVAVILHYQESVITRMRAIIGVVGDDSGSPLQYAMLLEQVTALWDLAFSLDPHGHPEVVAEIRALEHRFVADRTNH